MKAEDKIKELESEIKEMKFMYNCLLKMNLFQLWRFKKKLIR